MSLVICGREDVDILAGCATARFSEIKNNGSSMPVEPRHPWGGADGYSGIQQWSVPVKDTRNVVISWAMPEVRGQFASKPDRYLSHLMGHEGPGSILSCLKSKGLATDLMAGTFDSEAGYSTFSVQVGLTEEGLSRVDEVVAITYAYVGLLRAHGPLRWVYDETSCQAAVSFRFLNPSRPMSAATRLAQALLELPVEKAVSGAHLTTEWNPAAISELLALLTPENSRVRVSAKAVGDKCDRKEQWYGTQFGQQPLTSAQVARWTSAAAGFEALTKAHLELAAGKGDADGEITAQDGWVTSLSSALHLPAPNEFIASDFSLRHPSLAAAAKEEGSALAAVAAAVEGAMSSISAAADAVTGTLTSSGPSSAASGAGRKGPREPVPVLLRDDQRSTVWHHLDDHHAVPKAFLHAEVALPACYSSPRAIVLTDLYVRLLKESLNEFAYAAEVSELSYHAQVRNFEPPNNISTCSLVFMITAFSIFFDSFVSFRLRSYF